MGLPAPHETTDARVCAHLTELPDRRWWLDEVRLKDFPRIRRLTETPDRLRAAVDDAYFTPEAARVRERIVEVHGDTEAVRLNLLMVSAFLFHRKSVAVLDVAAEHLSADEVTLNTGLAGSQNRLALAALLYWKDRDLLVALDLWDRWHSRRRCVLGLEGHRRSPLPLPSIPWADLAADALVDLGDGDPLQLRAVVRRRGGREVMVAFRQVGEWSNVRSESGEVLPGREDDWTLLLFRLRSVAPAAASATSRSTHAHNAASSVGDIAPTAACTAARRSAFSAAVSGSTPESIGSNGPSSRARAARPDAVRHSQCAKASTHGRTGRPGS